MTSLDPDTAFERSLFDSAKADGPSEEQQRAAWRALTRSGALVAASAGSLSPGRGTFGGWLGAKATGKVIAAPVAGALLGSVFTC